VYTGHEKQVFHIPASLQKCLLSWVSVAENNDSPWRLEVSAEEIAQNLGAFYFSFDEDAMVAEPATPELVGAK
jgi:hypothetical protein